MLQQLRKKLTLTYSVWFFVTMLGVFVLLFIMVRSMLFQTANEEIQDILHYEAEKYKQRGIKEFQGQPNNQKNLYYSVIKKDSGMVAVKPSSKAEELFQKIMSKQTCCTSEGQLKDIRNPSGEPLHIIYASTSLGNGKSLFVGKNISDVHEKTEHWFFVLLLISLSVLIISVIIGDRLARRAMKPIIHNIESQKQFIADASHELRTPISIFTASLEVLEQEEKEKLSPFSQETLTEMKEEALQMKGLVSQLLTLAKEDAGQIRLTSESFSFTKLVQQIRAQYVRINNSARIDLTLPSEEVLVAADRMRVKELLHILLDNAIKYSEETVEIEINVQKEADNLLKFEVIDKGIGIEPSEIPFLFDRFYRVEKGRSRQTGGAGLGLAIAKTIVDLHGGSISVHSQQGAGTRITVKLPVLIKKDQ